MRRDKSIEQPGALVLPVDGFLRLRQVLQFVPVSRSVWYEGVRRGEYPQGVKLSASCVAWRAGDIRALLERLSARASQA